MDIWRKNVLEHTIVLDDRSVLSQRLMEEDKIQLNFTLEDAISLEIGDYVIYNGINYYLFTKPAVNKRNAKQYVYSLVFSGRMHLLEKVKFTSNGEPTFYLTGNLAFFMTAIRDEGRRIYGNTFDRQIFDSSTLTKTLYFDRLNLLEALQLVCAEFEKEFQFRNGVGQNLVIDIRNRITSSSTLSLRFKEGLRSIDVKQVNSEELITSLYVFGSERNIETTYGNKRLRLPFPGTNPRSIVENNVTEYGLIEGVVFFDDIYPRRTGTVSNIVNSGTTWKFRDSSLDFNLNDYLITESAKLTFNTGALAGNEFEILAFDNAIKEFEIKTFTDDQDLTLPNATIKPLAGDSYVLHNIKMPSSYLTNAENELAVKAQNYINQVSTPSLEINCVVDPVYLRRNSIEIKIGQDSLFNEPDIEIDNEVQRVVQLTRSLVNDYIYGLKFAANTITGKLKRLDTQISDNKKAIQIEAKNRLQSKFYNR